MANVDLEGIKRAREKEQNNQDSGRGERGYVHKAGTKGTGRIHGNGTGGGGINRSVKPTTQY